MKMSDHVWGPDVKGRAHPGFNIFGAKKKGKSGKAESKAHDVIVGIIYNPN
jgi:hypothetical protein